MVQTTVIPHHDYYNSLLQPTLCCLGLSACQISAQLRWTAPFTRSELPLQAYSGVVWFLFHHLSWWPWSTKEESGPSRTTFKQLGQELVDTCPSSPPLVRWSERGKREKEWGNNLANWTTAYNPGSSTVCSPNNTENVTLLLETFQQLPPVFWIKSKLVCVLCASLRACGYPHEQHTSH